MTYSPAVLDCPDSAEMIGTMSQRYKALLIYNYYNIRVLIYIVLIIITTFDQWNWKELIPRSRYNYI